MNILASTNKTSAVFLAIVLITGTIAAISPSFITGANAQAQPYYGMDSRPNSYGPSQYTDRDNSYNSYQSDHYGKDNNDKKSHENDNSYGKTQYQPSYKPNYSSYGEKDDKTYKSNKDNTKSVEISKLNCINTNLNINGNNTGDINLGNEGQEGYIGANANAVADDEGYYYDGQNYNNNDVDFDCIINNNNTNTNIVAGAGDNQTTAPKATLNVSKIVTCTYLVGGLTPEEACRVIKENITENQFLIDVSDDNPTPSQFPGSESGTIVTLGAGNYDVTETNSTSLQTQIEKLEDELKRLNGGGRGYEITGPIVSFTGDCIDANPINPRSTEATGTIADGESKICEIENHFDIGLAPLMSEGLTASNINTAGGPIASYSSPPAIAQETTEDNLSPMEKIIKLKQQWMELTP